MQRKEDKAEIGIGLSVNETHQGRRKRPHTTPHHPRPYAGWALVPKLLIPVERCSQVERVHLPVP